MKPDEILTFTADVVKTWAECVFQPLKTITKMMYGYDDDQALGALGKIWLPSLALSIIVNYPLMRLIGIEWNNVGYYSVYQSIVILGLLMSGMTAYVCLLVLRIKVEFYRILILYTIVVVYMPIVTLISAPVQYWYYLFLRSIKFAEQTPFEQVVYQIFLHDMINLHDTTITVNVIFYSTNFIFLLTMAAFAECVTQWYDSDRFRTYLATGIGVVLIGAVQRWVEFPLQSLTTYIFMK
jgi:hypothetical protein